MIPKNKKILVMLSLIATTFSCTTDRLPETAITNETYWQTESDLKLAANYFYTTLPFTIPTNLSNTSYSYPGLAYQDNWSDDAFGTGVNGISDGSRLVPASDGEYNSNYATIRAANNLLENSAKVLAKGINPTNVNWYVGEAKYFRARSYFNLLQRYGGVPLILKTLESNAPELTAAQGSRDEVLNVIYADLDDAISKVKTRTQLGTADYGRISRTAALALKAQVGLFEGTRAKFHGYGEPAKHLSIARTAALQVMQSGEHGLLGNYFNLTQLAGDGFANKENILVREYGVSTSNDISSHNTHRLLENGNSSPTKALVDSYLMRDGLPYTKSSLYRVPTKSVEVYDNRDPRMSAKFAKTGDVFSGTASSNNIFLKPDLSFTRTGYVNRSYQNTGDWTAQKSYIDLAITRYAEILLIYAEATFELNGSISDADLDLSINVLRQRPGVNMPKLTNGFVATHSLDMRTEIRRERRTELALEGFRYWDLIRWKTAEVELPKAMLGSFFFTEFGTNFSPALDANKFIIVESAANRRFDPARDYLWPFPTNELALNPNLKQNPKW